MRDNVGPFSGRGRTATAFEHEQRCRGHDPEQRRVLLHFAPKNFRAPDGPTSGTLLAATSAATYSFCARRGEQRTKRVTVVGLSSSS
jgi:hypothetical protein